MATKKQLNAIIGLQEYQLNKVKKQLDKIHSKIKDCYLMIDEIDKKNTIENNTKYKQVSILDFTD